MHKPYTAVSLFSGAGGLDLGFHGTGMVKTVACYEHSAIFAETLRLNQSSLMYGTGGELPAIHVEDLSLDETIAGMASLYSQTDIVFGGPPCQSFSIMGKKGGTNDPRGALIFSFAQVLHALQPKAFLFENVPNFLSIGSGEISAELKQNFIDMGYSLWSGIVNAADFGAFTFRRRFIIMGIKGGETLPEPVPTHSSVSIAGRNVDAKLPWQKCKVVFDAMDKAEKSGIRLQNHEKVNHTSQVIERFDKLAFGETDHIRKRNRLDPNRPAHSVYVGGKTGKLQARTHIHPYLPRELTARECAAIQGFPLDWEFAGRSDAATLQAANAVPVQLAHSLARHLVNTMVGNGIKPVK
jgi:DNA (cytosine-5)-methyltransferase 1